MRVLGVDPSSSVTGIAIADDEKLVYVDAFFANPKLDVHVNMGVFGGWIRTLCDFYGSPDVVVVEKVSVSYNVNTIRKISYFEAVAMLYGYDVRARVIQVQATKARRLTLQKGTLKKEACHVLMLKRFPEIAWKPAKKGGMDETDAAVLALAGPALLTKTERDALNVLVGG